MTSICPKVSIITLTYRHFNKLLDTVESVLLQDYSNIEYIISDDGSDFFPTEELEAYIEKMNFSHFPVHINRNPKNVGTVRNLNCAYRNATGDYFINLSCGDVFFDNTIVSKLVDRFLNTDARVLVTSRLLYENDFSSICLLPHYEERSIIEKLDTSLKQYRAFVTSKYYDMASGSAMYFTRDVIETYGFFDEKYRLWEDGPFLAKYLWQDRLEFAYDIISIWYETGGVSSAGFKGANPLLKKDSLLFEETDRRKHRNSLSFFQRQMLDYRLLRIKNMSKFSMLFIFIRYFPQAISFFLYGRQRTRYRLHDKKYITEILEQSS